MGCGQAEGTERREETSEQHHACGACWANGTHCASALPPAQPLSCFFYHVLSVAQKGGRTTSMVAWALPVRHRTAYWFTYFARFRAALHFAVANAYSTVAP